MVLQFHTKDLIILLSCFLSNVLYFLCSKLPRKSSRPKRVALPHTFPPQYWGLNLGYITLHLLGSQVLAGIIGICHPTHLCTFLFSLRWPSTCILLPMPGVAVTTGLHHWAQLVLFLRANKGKKAFTSPWLQNQFEEGKQNPVLQSLAPSSVC